MVEKISPRITDYYYLRTFRGSGRELPVTRRFKEAKKEIIIPDNWWEEGWKGYLRAVKEKGLGDPRRQPSGELMHKKCEI